MAKEVDMATRKSTSCESLKDENAHLLRIITRIQEGTSTDDDLRYYEARLAKNKRKK